MILAMGLCYGGTAQVIAGIMNGKRATHLPRPRSSPTDFFGSRSSRFCCCRKSFPRLRRPMKRRWPLIFRFGGSSPPSCSSHFEVERALQFVFGTLTILFALLAIGDFTEASPSFKHFTGYEGLVCGFAAIYTGLAQVLNELYGKNVLPLGAPKK